MEASEDWIPKETSAASWQSDLVTLGRYRARTLNEHYLPSFETTMKLMRDVAAEIEAEIHRLHTYEEESNIRHCESIHLEFRVRNELLDALNAKILEQTNHAREIQTR